MPFLTDADPNDPTHESFKAKENEAYRVSFVWWPTVDGLPTFGRRPLFFADRALSHGDPDQPRATIATIIAIWPTDRKGNLDKERFVRGDVDVRPWVFSEQVYDALIRRNHEFPFAEHDLSIACSDTLYQKMDLSPCRESLFAKALTTEKLSHIATSIQLAVDQIAPTVPALVARPRK